MTESFEIVDRLRALPERMRRTPMPIKDIIPAILEAADEIERLLKLIELESTIKASRHARGKTWSPDRR